MGRQEENYLEKLDSKVDAVLLKFATQPRIFKLLQVTLLVIIIDYILFK